MGKRSHVSRLSRDQSLQRDTWILSGTQGNVFGNPRAVIDSSQTSYQGILHFWNQNATGGDPVRDNTGRSVAKGQDRIGSTISMPSFCEKTINHDEFPPPSSVMYMEDEIQKTNELLFRISLRDNVMDQRSGDGVGGRSQVIALNPGLSSFCRILSC